MDHDEVREQLELAAVEPDGLDRLIAGDTPTAMAVAGHLAGCADCTQELVRLGRAVPLLRDVVRTTPPADLRDRTLAFVRARGIERGGTAPVHDLAAASVVTPFPRAASDPDAVLDEPAAAAIAAGHTAPAAAAAATAARPARSLPAVLPWVAAIAAAVVISVVATTALIGARIDDQLAAQQQQIAGLEKVTLGTLAITAEPDEARVALASTDGSPTAGQLLFSPGTTDLVVVATGLTAPPAGQEYRCWVEVDGTRSSIGKMFFSTDLAYWVGDAPAVAGAPAGTTFGVSLTEVGGATPQADPVIVGQL